ncbi:maleylacetoacetate isomerase [Paraburkholderia sediminicola]|uniref:maleylacetoacetate isomerase n=1 Tax=Paraburkholderia sediminicola TaxID=458836 RepID=UPI0038B7E3C6
MKLYSFHRSTASFRVRIALHFKGIPFDTNAVHLLRGDGEQHAEAYRRLNPQRLLPTLVDGKNVLTQSLAICEYLEETHPSPALLPAGAAPRARVRGLATALAADIHPLHTIRVTRHLANAFDIGENERLAWTRHWIHDGLSAIEEQLSSSPATGIYSHGDSITLADVFLVPQVLSAKAYGVDIEQLAHITRITTRCLRHPAFDAALPVNQPDAA